ncbi:helix-turn-helix domain-containing protein [Parabacteroides distasonis]|nr:helix-turn-helix domain-containing protein [Parabacteroides distasonis]
MERTDMSITAIAAKLGFSQPSVFSKFFRTLTKSQPWEWRIEKKNRAQTGREPIIATSNQQAIHAQTHAKCAISSAKFFVIKNV